MGGSMRGVCVGRGGWGECEGSVCGEGVDGGSVRGVCVGRGWMGGV